MLLESGAKAMSTWQIAAGSYGRDYSDRFLKHGMAFAGGEFWASMKEVAPGDRVILKSGISQIIAVGEVVARNGVHCGKENKEWLSDFDGWDLNAWCYVDWHKPDEHIPTTGLTRSTIQRVNQEHLLKIADNIIETVPKRLDYAPDPRPTTSIGDGVLIEKLIDLGLPVGASEEMNHALGRIRLLAKFYTHRDLGLTNEHEARTFLVVPLLLALGWAEQRIRIELPVPGVGRADVGCFKKPFRGSDDKCMLLIETKNLGQGLDYAPTQARQYAVHFPECGTVLVTNGYCYKAYRREENAFATDPCAYLNLLDLRDRYPLDPDRVGGALDVLELLLP